MLDRAQPVVSLGVASLVELRHRGLRVPSYDRSQLRPRIAHIGVGGFHRAHLAVYCHRLAEQGGDWGIRGIGLLAGDAAMEAALGAQDHLYTFTQKGPGDPVSEVIGSIVDYRLAVDDPRPAIDAIADPVTAIVSLTVTEAGYGDDALSRRTFDIIAAGLAARRDDGLAGVTILSCDNLPGNGDVVRRSVRAAAQRCGPGVATWVDEHCTFPNSMVDRITPTTADADRDDLVRRFGLADRWPVVAEPFWQWALQDRFAVGRPAFDEVGVLLTDDVHAWELYKLRLLNAGHSAIAYLSALAGIEFVDEAIADPTMQQFLSTLLTDEAVPTLTPIPGHSREYYVATVLQRFANTGVRDQIARLCIDGTAKFPTFLVPTISAQLRSEGRVALAALAFAGWCHYLADIPEGEQARDERGAPSRALARAARTDPLAFLAGNAVFPDDVADHPEFRHAFERAHRLITERGPIAAIAATLEHAR